MDIFKESNGKISSNRIMFVIGLTWAMIITTTLVFRNQNWTSGDYIGLFAGLSAPFITLKVVQKPMEKQ